MSIGSEIVEGEGTVDGESRYLFVCAGPME